MLQRTHTRTKGSKAHENATTDRLKNIDRSAIHLVGIAGQGMSALAEVLLARGAAVTGSDVDEQFFTTSVLERIGVSVLPFCLLYTSPSPRD